MNADINTIETGDKLEIEGTDEQTGKTSTRTVTAREINTKQKHVYLHDDEGNKVAYIAFYIGGDAHLRSMGGQLIARLNSMEIVSRQPRDVDFDELESCVTERHECVACERVFTTRRGLRVHQGHTHPAINSDGDVMTAFEDIEIDTSDAELVTDGGEDVDEIMAEEAHNLTKILDELRDVHGEPAHEDENVVILADSYGNELNEIAANTDGVTREDVSEWMHDMAFEIMGENKAHDRFSYDDPVVVLKWNEGQNPHLQNVKENL